MKYLLLIATTFNFCLLTANIEVAGAGNEPKKKKIVSIQLEPKKNKKVVKKPKNKGEKDIVKVQFAGATDRELEPLPATQKALLDKEDLTEKQKRKKELEVERRRIAEERKQEAEQKNTKWQTERKVASTEGDESQSAGGKNKSKYNDGLEKVLDVTDADDDDFD